MSSATARADDWIDDGLDDLAEDWSIPEEPAELREVRDMHAALTARAARDKLRAWRDDPVLFCHEALGFVPWHCDDLGCDTQRDILRSCAKHDSVAVRSGHKDGKTKLVAALALWEFACWPGSRTILTAPTHRQINEVIWREVRDLYLNALIRIGGQLAVTPGGGLRHRRVGANGTPVGVETQVFGFSTDEADRFSGISGPRVTYIVDEASGLSAPVYRAIAGNRMGGARLILISNPTQPTGEFYDAFHGKAALYVRHHMSSVLLAQAIEDGRVPRIRGLADAATIQRFAREHGRDSDEFRVRADGEFASRGAMSVIVAEDYDAAVQRWSPLAQQLEWLHHRLEIGVDVAHFGDDASVIQGRRGRHVLAPEPHHKLDGPQLAQKIFNYCRKHRYHRDASAAGLRPRVRIEAVGVGVSCYDALRHSPHAREIEIVKFDPAGKSREARKFVNLRAEAWFNARKLLSAAPYQLPESTRLREDALAPQYKFDKTNRYQIEAKKEIKKRLGRSPDYGDALVICLWDPPEGFARTVRIPGL